MPLPCDNSSYPPGVIGVASSFLGRYREFDVDLARVLAPRNSVVEWRMGVNIAHHFNNMIRTMLADPNLQWVWILGDDHVFRPDTLMNLLARQVDMVTPLCLRRSIPYETVLHTNAEDGYKLVPLVSIARKRGLLDVTDLTMGNAGTLISRKLCEAIPEPWYENGKTHPEYGGSDLYFCEKVRAAGFKMFMDMETVIGHMTHAAVWPVRGVDGYTGELLAPSSGAAPVDEKVDWKQIFNDYRENYDTLPFANHVALYEVIAKFFPNQKQYDLNSVVEFLKSIPDAKVLELGGWKGELAKEVLEDEGVKVASWDNFEICKTAVDDGFSGEVYKAHKLDNFFQPNGEGYNTLILSHVLEHMKFSQFQELIAGLSSVDNIYIDAPIQPNDSDVDWTDYLGTHVLEVGWESILAALLDQGFTLTSDTPNIKCFKRVL